MRGLVITWLLDDFVEYPFAPDQGASYGLWNIGLSGG